MTKKNYKNITGITLSIRGDEMEPNTIRQFESDLQQVKTLVAQKYLEEV